MDDDLLERLLYEEEGPSLDLKISQYAFESVSNDEKSELLKDILAFANSWRREDAYILIGVDEVKGGRSKIVGIANHLDDAKLQQFVNSKTQRPVTFSSRPYITIEGKIGVIKIDCQDRPTYLIKAFGKLADKIVYLRRGSSTDTASPDEIIKMSSQTIAEKNPDLDLCFADSRSKINLGKSVVLKSTILQYDEESIPSYGTSNSILDVGLGSWSKNRNYFRDYASYLKLTSFYQPVSLVIRNLGSMLTPNVRVKIVVEANQGLYVLGENSYPNRPSKESGISIPKGALVSRLSGLRRTTDVQKFADRWDIEGKFLNVQPKDDVILEDRIFFGAQEPISIELNATIYADNLADPINVTLNLDVKTEHEELNLADGSKLWD